MNAGREHAEVQELLGAYALDALDGDERALVEEHLAGCHWCQVEVAEHHEVAGLLARSGAPAPSALWDRIAATIEDTSPPPLRLVGAEPPRRRPRLATWVAAAAAVIAVASLSVAVLDADDDGPAAPVSLAEAASRAIAEPEALRAELRAADGRLLAYAAVLPDGDGYLLPSGLPELDDGVYQLWGRTGDHVVSLGVFDGDDGVVGFHAQDGVEEIMVTEEEAPVEQPVTAPLVRGDLA